MNSSDETTLSAGQLRRIKLFADLTEDQITHFTRFAECMPTKPNQVIVKMGQHGDCMFMILKGSARISRVERGRETELAKLETGDFFGEICLCDEGPRSADVVANEACTLLRLTREGFLQIMSEHPDVAAGFLFAMVRHVGARMRKMNRRHMDSMLMSSLWGGGPGHLAEVISVK